MRNLLANPTGILLICCVSGLALSTFATMYGLLRGDKRIVAETSRWSRAFGGGREGQRRQQADLDALRQAVAKIEAENAQRTEPPETPIDDA